MVDAIHIITCISLVWSSFLLPIIVESAPGELKPPSDKAKYRWAEGSYGSESAKLRPLFHIGDQPYTTPKEPAHWWKVYLNQPIYITKIEVDTDAMSSFFILLGNETEKATRPPQMTDLGSIWRVAHFQSEDKGRFNLVIDNVNDVAEIVMIYNVVATGITLYNFFVFGLVPPRFSPLQSSEIKASHDKLEFTFTSFDSNAQLGDIQPHTYFVWVEEELVTTIKDGIANKPLPVTITNLNPDTQYSITVTCLYKEDFQCIGPSHPLIYSTTPCQAPSKPRNLEIVTKEAISREQHQQQWLYKIQWEEPSAGESNAWGCDGPHKTSAYRIGLSLDETITETPSTQADVYISGATSLIVSVWSVNTKSIQSETAATLEIRTGQLAPREPPSNVTLKKSVSQPKCMDLVWKPPEHPNADIKNYLYCCNGKDWFEHTNLAKLETTVCGLAPYSALMCQVKARTDLGDSQAAWSNLLRTPCDKPEKAIIESVDQVLEKIEGLEKVTITIKVDVNANTSTNLPDMDRMLLGYDIKITRDGLVEYHVTTNHTNITLQDLMPHKEYLINLATYNDEYLYSDAMLYSLVTKDADPYRGPDLFVASYPESGCIQVTAYQPETANSPVLTYKYQCAAEVPTQYLTEMCGNSVTSTAAKMKRVEQSICVRYFMTSTKLICTSRYSRVGREDHGPEGMFELYANASLGIEGIDNEILKTLSDANRTRESFLWLLISATIATLFVP